MKDKLARLLTELRLLIESYDMPDEAADHLRSAEKELNAAARVLEGEEKKQADRKHSNP